MAATVSYSSFGEFSNTLQALAQKRLQVVWGTFNYGATAGGGATWTFPFANVGGCVIEPANGYVYKFDIDNKLVKAYRCGAPGSLTTAVAMAQVATGTDMSTCTAIVFFAWGYE